MEIMVQDEMSGKRAPHEVAEAATAAELLQEVCTLFGRTELDSALEVDGVVVCTGVSEGDATVSNLGLHSNSSVVLRHSLERERRRALSMLTGYRCGCCAVDLKRIREWMWDDEEIVLAAIAVQRSAFASASARLKSSGSFMRRAVGQFGFLLQFDSADRRADKTVVLAAVAASSEALEHASESLRADKEVVLAAASSEKRIFWQTLQYASESLRADKEVVLAFVAKNSASLQHASDSLRADKEVVLTAASGEDIFGQSLQYASESLRADKEVVLAFVAKNSAALQFASESLRA
eukprot:Rhum_TRINITY_DN14864_c1_g1::Rhum_TRINITY_DN14864_c1_g1_i1::g.122610::m.122610